MRTAASDFSHCITQTLSTCRIKKYSSPLRRLPDILTISHTLSFFCPTPSVITQGIHYILPGLLCQVFLPPVWSLKPNPQLCDLDDPPGSFACSASPAQSPEHFAQCTRPFPATLCLKISLSQLVPLCPSTCVLQSSMTSLASLVSIPSMKLFIFRDWLLPT